MSVTRELCASRNSCVVSRPFTSAATAIIIPNTVEISASSPSGTATSSTRSFLIRGRPRGVSNGMGSAVRSLMAAAPRHVSWLACRGGGPGGPGWGGRPPPLPPGAALLPEPGGVLPDGGQAAQPRAGPPPGVERGNDPAPADIHLRHPQ